MRFVVSLDRINAELLLHKYKTTYLWERYFPSEVGYLGVSYQHRELGYCVCLYPDTKKEVIIHLANTSKLSLSEARYKFFQLLKEYDFMPLQSGNYRLGTFTELIQGYVDDMRRNGKRTYKAVAEALEKEALTVISPDTPARDVTSQVVSTILSNIIKRKAPTQSNRVRSYLVSAFNYGLRHDNDPLFLTKGIKFSLKSNPALVVPKQSYAERAGERFLTYNELTQLIKDCYKRKLSDSYSRLILILIFTGGQRPYEIMHSKWSDVDFYHWEWVLPSSITKNKRAHLIPLTRPVVELLREQSNAIPNSEYIFPNTRDPLKPGRTDSFSQAVRRYCLKTNFTPFTPRDIRRTCKTLMSRFSSGSKETLDRLHNHSLNDVSTKHYNRYDYRNEKKKSLGKWNKTLQKALQ